MEVVDLVGKEDVMDETQIPTTFKLVTLATREIPIPKEEPNLFRDPFGWIFWAAAQEEKDNKKPPGGGPGGER